MVLRVGGYERRGRGAGDGLVLARFAAEHLIAIWFAVPGDGSQSVFRVLTLMRATTGRAGDSRARVGGEVRLVTCGV